MLKGFRQFLLRGNVIDLAVAVVIGGAFGAVVTALVKDLITPLIAAIVGKPDFSAIKFTITTAKLITIEIPRITGRSTLVSARYMVVPSPGSWKTVSMKTTPVNEMTMMSMLSIATTGRSALWSTCFLMMRNCEAPLARAVRT